MWIKASGKWLADADRDDIFVRIPLEETRRHFAKGANLSGTYATRSGTGLAASIETAMHALIPHRVVVHLHSINAIAWAVRQDGCAQVARRLAGLPWRWIPYVPSGLPLAREISAALASDPGTKVLLLANHGLVLCDDTSEAVEDLLWDVERRLAIPPERFLTPIARRFSRWYEEHAGVCPRSRPFTGWRRTISRGASCRAAFSIHARRSSSAALPNRSPPVVRNVSTVRSCFLNVWALFLTRILLPPSVKRWPDSRKLRCAWGTLLRSDTYRKRSSIVCCIAMHRPTVPPH